MSEVEDDIYFDAISTGGPLMGPVRGDDATGASSNGATKTEDAKGQGRVSQLASRFMEQASNQTAQPSKTKDQITSNANSLLQKISELESPDENADKAVGDTKSKTFAITGQSQEAGSSVYSFATPFQEGVDTDKLKAVGQGQDQNEADGGKNAVSLVDPDKSVLNLDQSEHKEHTHVLNDQNGAKDEGNVPVNDRHYTIPAGTVFENNFEQLEEENLYDSVHNSLDSRNRSVDCAFEFVHHEQVGVTVPSSKSPCGNTDERQSYDWKRKQAKKKSRALKRPTKSDKEGNPFTQESQFDDPHKGALPEAEDENMGLFNPFSNVGTHRSESSSSFFSDSTFDTSTSDSDQDEAFFNKPLPPKPKKDHQILDLAHKVLPGHHKKENEDGTPILERVLYKRPRSPPTLPSSAGPITQDQVKLRGVLQSLIDSERNYISSLERLNDGYREHILSNIKKPEVKVTFQKIEEITSIHKMFQIEFTEKLKKWNTDEQIGSIFHVFSSKMTVDIYSEYVNNYEAASEHIREVENSNKNFKEFLKKRQMESVDRLSLAGLMLKPVQRFPQFIMIIKDLLKFTSRDHHDRAHLQEALTWIENVAHQLNERKRQSEQVFHGQQLMNKLTPRIHPEKNVFLIRQDDMEQLSQDTAGSHFTKQRRIFLMNDRLVSVHVTHRDQDPNNSERFTYKWHQNLRDLELTTSAITPNMQTTVSLGNTSSTILSPKTERSDEDPYDVASDLTDMMHDISVLAKINQLVSTLKLAYPGLTEDSLHDMITRLQKNIQSKDYELQMLNSSTIILQDKVRKRKYVFSASNANVKQEWCIDFLLAKYAIDIINIPSWYKPDSKDSVQPALLMKHMSVDMQRTFTRVSCGVKVYFPKKNEGSMEHIWVCSSTEGQGQVSVVSLHTDKPSLIESFQATKCMIICVECVAGFATVKKKGAFEEDTVWMSTADSEIQVFMLSEKQGDLHRRCHHVFDIGCIVISMRYVDDMVYCGSRNGGIIVFCRDEEGFWSEIRRITLDIHAVTSLICVGDNIWAACGSKIYIIDIDTQELKGTVDHQLANSDDNFIHFEYLVKTGVGVWSSFIGQPNICLYHSETRKLIQESNINTAVHEFIKVYSGVEERKNFQVSCLLASLGFLWVGTNIGIILVYPLPRLRDGVPRINERPQVALHSHSGPVKFLLPVHYGPVSGAPIRRRMESVLKKYRVEDSVIKNLTKIEENRPNTYISLDEEGMARENLYEDVEFRGYHKDRDSQIYDEISNLESPTEHHKRRESSSPRAKGAEGESELLQSDEHKYFVLEPQKNVGDESVSESFAAVKPEKGKEDDQVLLRSKERKYTYDRKVSMPVSLESHRRSMTTSYDDRFGFKPAFQSELKNKLKLRQSLEDLTDCAASTEHEVNNLYPTLLRPKTISNPAKSLRDSVLSASLPDVSDVSEPQKEYFYRRPRMSVHITTQRPDFPSTKNLNKETKKKDKKSNFNFVSKKESPPKEKPVKGARRSVSFHKDDTLEQKRKNAIGTSFSQGSSVDTLSKQDSNTIMVISAGDGYKDWKKRQSIPNYRPEEPCLMFWMYKF